MKLFKMARKYGSQLVAGGAMLVGTVAAHAALPADAAAALSSVQTAVGDTLSGVWPIIGAVIAGFTTIKLVKRGANKV